MQNPIFNRSGSHPCETRLSQLVAAGLNAVRLGYSHRALKPTKVAATSGAKRFTLMSSSMIVGRSESNDAKSRSRQRLSIENPDGGDNLHIALAVPVHSKCFLLNVSTSSAERASRYAYSGKLTLSAAPSARSSIATHRSRTSSPILLVTRIASWKYASDSAMSSAIKARLIPIEVSLLASASSRALSIRSNALRANPCACALSAATRAATRARCVEVGVNNGRLRLASHFSR